MRRGRAVRVLDNLSTGHRENLAAVAGQIDFVEGDILDPAAVRAAMRGVGRVFHQAALRSVPRSVDDPQSSNRVNVEGTLNILVAARDASVERVVYASSSSVYGRTDVLPLVETMAPQPVSPYLCPSWPVILLQVFTRVYASRRGGCATSTSSAAPGPASQYAAVVPRFIAAAFRGESLEIHGDGCSRGLHYVGNVVAANCLAAESPPRPARPSTSRAAISTRSWTSSSAPWPDGSYGAAHAGITRPTVRATFVTRAPNREVQRLLATRS